MEINLRNVIRGGLTLLFLVIFNILHYHSADRLTKLEELRGSGATVTSAKTYDSPVPVPRSLPKTDPQSRPARRNLSQAGALPEAEETVSDSHFIRTGFSRRPTPISSGTENSKKNSPVSANAAKPVLSAGENAKKVEKKAFSSRQKQEIQSVAPFPFNLRLPWISAGREEEDGENAEVWSPGMQPHRLTPVTLSEELLAEDGGNGEVLAAPEMFPGRAKPVIHPIFPPVGAHTQDLPAHSVPDERFMEAAPVKPLRLDLQFQQSTKTLPEVPVRHADAHAGKWGEWRKHGEDAAAELGQMPAFAELDAPDSVAETRAEAWPEERNLITEGIFRRPEAETYVREEVYMPTARHFGVRKPILPEDDGESDFPVEFYPSLRDFPAVENEEITPDLRYLPKEIWDFPPLEEEITEVPYQPQA